MTDDIRQRHVLCDAPPCIDSPQHCASCSHGWYSWPCDAIRMADELDKESMERADAERALDKALAIRDEALSLALDREGKALAALVEAALRWDDSWGTDGTDLISAIDAYREATK